MNGSSCLWLVAICHTAVLQSKKEYKLASIAQIAYRSCGNNRFRERSPSLKTTFDEAQKFGKSAFLGFLKYALVCEPRRS